MALLELEHVAKRYGQGSRTVVVLRDVCLQLEASEIVAVWGPRRSGRSTLLRVATGIEEPDSGVVHFAGRELAGGGGELLGNGVGYCRKTLRRDVDSVLDGVKAGLLGCEVRPSAARERARGALERAGATHCAALRPHELDGADAVRVGVARALALQPKLLVIDEPTLGMNAAAGDGVLLLLRSLADEGIAILMSTGETPALSGADRALTLEDGKLHGGSDPEPASIHYIARHRRPASA
jgi:ABC-type lipoprotein export system ATPase subunit